MPTSISKTDVILDLHEYTTPELFALFKLSDTEQLTSEHLFHAKQIAMRIHPDKSGLDPQYFRFFWTAYNALVTIHVYQVGGYATGNTDNQANIALTEEQMALLDQLFHHREELRDSKQFNQWFNDQFPSDDSKNTSNNNPIANSNVDSADLSSSTSIRGWGSAVEVDGTHVAAIPRINSVEELSRARSQAIRPMSTHNAVAEFAANDRRCAAEAADRAFKHVQQTLRSQEQQQAFWKRLKLLT